MRRSFLDSVLRGAEALAARDGVGTLPDPDLVGRFAAGRDPTAFAVLVRRHGPLVWAVCRNLLPADADAEDAFQATFLALVRSAGTIRRTEALAGWLHGVAYRVAVKARRAAARRKQREARAAIPENSSTVPDAAWDELQAAVHEEVCKLPDKLRLPFILCALQGRSQKETAAVLGWKVGTVSGRLSEARRTLLERLARRGVPAGVAAGATVLGVAGHAAVPPSLNSKVLSVAGSPAAVPSSVLSLARGVTPMYLTRTKLLAAGIVLAGLLTTSVGLLSRADAQAPPGTGHAEALRQYYEALRVTQAPRDRWEYRFVPVDKPLTTADLQKVLVTADQEGWTYCGSQDLIHQKTDKSTPHMVFKRPRAGGVAANVDADLQKLAEAAKRAEAAAHEDATRARRTALEQLRRAEVEKSNRLAGDRTGAEKAARDEADRAREAEARVRAELERAVRDATAAQDQNAARAATERALREQEAARRQELEAVKAKYEALLRELQAETKAKSQPPAKNANPPAKKPEPQANNPYQAAPDNSNSVRVALKHVTGQAAANTLTKLVPSAKVVIDESTNSLVVMGPANVTADARALLEKLIDVPTSSSKPGAAKPEYVMIVLKHASADELARVMEELFGEKGPRFVAIPSTNTLLAYGTPADLDDVKKLVIQLDDRAKPAK